MAQPLVLIVSCHTDRARGCHTAVRETWGAQTRIPYRFLLGTSPWHDMPAQDEWAVDAGDDYWSMGRKQQYAYRRAVFDGYWPIFTVCVDTYIRVPRLLAHMPKGVEYLGCQVAGEQHASGGFGFWLNQHALEMLAHHTTLPQGYGDKVVGDALREYNITLTHDPAFAGDIAVHLSRGTGNYDPQWMRDFHAAEAIV